MELNLQNNLDNNLQIKNINNQNNFLTSTLGKAINNGIDIGLRCILPDYLEDQIIELKNNLFSYGLKDGIRKSVESVIDTGKTAIGLVTGDFKNVSQIQAAVKSDGIIDSVSGLLDDVLDKAKDSGKLDRTIINLMKNGKNSILNHVEKNVKKTLNSQILGIENLEKHIENWKDNYNNQDFNLMEKEYKKIQNEIKNLVPIQNTIDNVRTIEILHNLIKNNNKNFNLTKDEIELAQKLNIN